MIVFQTFQCTQYIGMFVVTGEVAAWLILLHPFEMGAFNRDIAQ